MLALNFNNGLANNEVVDDIYFCAAAILEIKKGVDLLDDKTALYIFNHVYDSTAFA